MVYKCIVLNPILDHTVGGSYARLHVSPGQYTLHDTHLLVVLF